MYTICLIVGLYIFYTEMAYVTLIAGLIDVQSCVVVFLTAMSRCCDCNPMLLWLNETSLVLLILAGTSVPVQLLVDWMRAHLVALLLVTELLCCWLTESWPSWCGPAAAAAAAAISGTKTLDCCCWVTWCLTRDYYGYYLSTAWLAQDVYMEGHWER